MASDKVVHVGGGVGVFGILGIVFIVLKLVGVVSWSWWWVLAPFWIPWAIAGFVLVAVGIGFLLYFIFKKVA